MVVSGKNANLKLDITFSQMYTCASEKINEIGQMVLSASDVCSTIRLEILMFFNKLHGECRTRGGISGGTL